MGFTVLFGRHNAHSDDWQAKRTGDHPDLCPGKDPLDTLCKCPDLMYATKIRIATGETIHNRLYCGCCELEVLSFGRSTP